MDILYRIFLELRNKSINKSLLLSMLELCLIDIPSGKIPEYLEGLKAFRLQYNMVSNHVCGIVAVPASVREGRCRVENLDLSQSFWVMVDWIPGRGYPLAWSVSFGFGCLVEDILWLGHSALHKLVTFFQEYYGRQNISLPYSQFDINRLLLMIMKE